MSIAQIPVGRKGNLLHVSRGTNKPTQIGGRTYSGHALDRMQSQGIPSSAVENTIQVGQAVLGKIPGTIAYYDQINNLTVITDSSSSRVITVDYGQIKQGK